MDEKTSYELSGGAVELGEAIVALWQVLTAGNIPHSVRMRIINRYSDTMLGVYDREAGLQDITDD